jgi:hypothetical protein
MCLGFTKIKIKYTRACVQSFAHPSRRVSEWKQGTCPLFPAVYFVPHSFVCVADTVSLEILRTYHCWCVGPLNIGHTSHHCWSLFRYVRTIVGVWGPLHRTHQSPLLVALQLSRHFDSAQESLIVIIKSSKLLHVFGHQSQTLWQNQVTRVCVCVCVSRYGRIK